MDAKRTDLTRRNFVMGLGVASAGLAAAGLIGCSDDSSNAEADQGAPNDKAVADENASWDIETDILIVGSGFAGLCAAIEATKAGSEVVLLEKNTVFGGNSIMCAGNAQFGGGNFVQERAGISDTPERFYNDIFVYGSHRAEPVLLQQFVDLSNETVDWMADELGIEFSENVSQNEGHEVPCSLMPAPSDNYPGSGGISYWYAMYAKAVEQGTEMHLEHKVTKILQDGDGAVIGLEYEAEGATRRAKARQAVILGSGGWKSNEAMRRNWDSRLDSDLSAGGLPYVETTGELINEAVDIGAGLRDMSYVCEFRFKWGTRLYQGWTPVDIENPPSLSTGMRFSTFNNVVMVDKGGNRFVDENAADEYPQEPFYEAFLNQEAPRSVWAVVDADEAAALEWDISALENPTEEEPPYLNEERVAIADTLDDLASQMGVPVDALKATVDKYNGFVEAKKDADFGKEDMSAKVEKVPFYAVKMQFFAHDQMGGLVANSKAQVCKRSAAYGPDPITLDDQEVIPRLYAAGENVGGYVGEDRGHGKISIYMVYGRIAGQVAAMESRME